MRWTADAAVRAARALAASGSSGSRSRRPGRRTGHVRILREGGLPVAAGENLRTLHEFERSSARAGSRSRSPTSRTCGGVTVWLKVAHLAEAHNLPVTSHGVHDLHVHLLAAVPNASYLEAHGFGLERFIAHPLEIRDGVAIAPDRPGHGSSSTARAWKVCGPPSPASQNRENRSETELRVSQGNRSRSIVLEKSQYARKSGTRYRSLAMVAGAMFPGLGSPAEAQAPPKVPRIGVLIALSRAAQPRPASKHSARG